MPRPSPKDYQNVFDSKSSSSNPSMFSAQYQQPQSQPSLYSSTPTSESPQSWPPYDQPTLPPFQSQPLPFRGFSTAVPFSATRLSTSPRLNVSTSEHAAAANSSRFTLAGSLDPATGIFYRTPEHPRLRTAQACEKCRTRKAKCSGEHPACKRCITRGLVCEYAKEGRVRGPNRVRNASNVSGSSQKSASTSEAAELEPHQPRTSSTDSSTSSKDQVTSPISPTDDRNRAGEQIAQLAEDVPPSPAHSHPVAHRLKSSPQVDFIPLTQQPSPRPPSSQGPFARNSDSLAIQPASHDPESAIGGHLGEYRASRTHPVDLLAFPEPWPSQEPCNVAPPRQAGQWIGQSSVEMGTGFNFGYSIEHQYPRRLLNHAQQQQERHLRTQRLIPPTSPFVLQYENSFSTHPSQQLAPFSTYPLPAQHLQQPMNYGISVYPSQYDELTYPQEVDYIQQPQPFIQSNHAFTPREHDPNVLVQGDCPRIQTDTGATERGLHPSLSRMNKRLEISNGTGESGAVGNAAESPIDQRDIRAATGRVQGETRQL